jgi:hypothetical protein
VLDLAEIQSMLVVVLHRNQEAFLGAILPGHVMIAHRCDIVGLGITNGTHEEDLSVYFPWSWKRCSTLGIPHRSTDRGLMAGASAIFLVTCGQILRHPLTFAAE